MSVTTDDVASWLGQPELSTADEVLVAKCLSAVVAHVIHVYYVPTDTNLWPDNVDQAVTMWAALLWRSKDSALGVSAAFPDLGPVYVRASDPRINELLSPYAPMPGVV
jgi:hypothetical protein